MTLPVAGLGGDSEQETVTSTKAMATATRKRKEREVPNNQTHERGGQAFSTYVQTPATQAPYSGICTFSTLLKLPSET